MNAVPEGTQVETTGPTSFSVASVLCLIIVVSLKSSVAHDLPHHLKKIASGL